MSYEPMTEMPALAGDLYWLADQQTGLLATLYENEPDPDPVLLFEETSFSPQASQSPVLFSLSPHGGLTSRLSAHPQKLDGLLISTRASRAELLEHLRSLLEARFLQGRKALLRYYDPRVASYLWPTCRGSLQGRWLGPLDELVWFGGTWSDEAAGIKQWHLLRHEDRSPTPPSAGPLALSDEQLQRLVDQGNEQYAWRWLQDHEGYAMDDVLDWIRSGLAAGHKDQSSLNAWLDAQITMQGEQQG